MLVHVPPITVDPPPITVTPPSMTVTPPSMTVTPPAITVGGVTVNPPAMTVNPPAITVNPPSITVDPPPITVNPPSITVDPPPITVDLLTWGKPKFRTLVPNGNPRNRLDVVIIGDGYTASEQALFQSDTDKVINAFRTTEPMKTYFNHFNFHRVDVISPESGTDDIHAHPPIVRRTALHTFFSPISERRLVGPDPWVMQVVTMSGAPWDEIIVLVNSPRRGGATLATMTIAYASRNSKDFPAIAIHEAGHSIANVMDEYTEDELPDIDWPADWVLPVPLPWVNVDTNFANPKWSVWLTPGLALPTTTGATVGTVGAFQGAAYTNSGVYRPQEHCLMREHDQSFCVVCSEAWISSIYRRSRLADAWLPAYDEPAPPLLRNAGTMLTFRASVVHSADIRTVWSTRKGNVGNWTVRQDTANYADFSTALPADTITIPSPPLPVPPGWPVPPPVQINVPTHWQVQCLLEDKSSRIRTPSVQAQARQEHIWNIITS